MRGGIGQKRHVARVFQRNGKAALVFGAGACLAARLDFGALRDVAAQTPNILVINLTNMIHAESADLAARAKIAATSAASRTHRTVRAIRTIRALWAVGTIRPLRAGWAVL